MKGRITGMIGTRSTDFWCVVRDESVFVAEYKSIKDTAIAMSSTSRSSDIINCAKGNIPSAFGFDWRYTKN